MKRAVIHNVAVAMNYSDDEDAGALAEQVIAKINQLIKTTHIFGLVNPTIISQGHPVSLVIDQDDDVPALEQAFGD